MDLYEEVKKVINTYPEEVKSFKAGKGGYIGLFVGHVMKNTSNEADPKLVKELLLKLLS